MKIYKSTVFKNLKVTTVYIQMIKIKNIDTEVPISAIFRAMLHNTGEKQICWAMVVTPTLDIY